MYCNRCGTRLQQGTAICPECGARQHRQTRDIRCARCGGRASVEMAVCPHCGRNLVPAGPRWALWIPLALIVAFAAYWGWGKLPVQQVKQEAAAAQAKLSSLVQIPELATPTATPTQGSLVARSTQPSPTATWTPTPTPTRPPSATAVAGAKRHSDQRPGGVCRRVRRFAGADRRQTRPSLADDRRDQRHQPEHHDPPGRQAETADLHARAHTPGGDRCASGNRCASGHRCDDGRAGGYGDADCGSYQHTDQRPTVPPTAPPAATASPPTATPRPTATPAPTPTPAPTSTPAPSLSAPVLLMPGDRNSSTGEGTPIVLQWQTKENLPLGTVYRVTITDTEQGVPVTHTFDWKATSFPVPPWLWGKADQPARQYQWSVQVVQLATDGKGGERVIELSPPSETRTFFWN